jgi:asparagine synthase (glutamine-hydrolysing)
MNGIFGFAIYDVDKDEYFVAQTIWELFHYILVGINTELLCMASELKALEGYCTKIQLFPPGHYMTSKDGEFVQWYKREWTDYDAVKTTKQVYCY